MCLRNADTNGGHGRRSPPPALPPGIPPPPVLPAPGAPAPQPGIPLPAPPPGLPNGAAHGCEVPIPAQNGVADDTAPAAAAADAAPATGSNQSAAQLLRARMRASVKRASPEGSEDTPAAAANDEAPTKKLRTAQPDDGAATAAAGAADDAVAPAELVMHNVDMQQPAAGNEADGPDVAPGAVKLEGGAVAELVQASAEVPQSDVKMETEAEAAQASALNAASAGAEQFKAEEDLAAEQPDEAEQLDEAGQDDEVWCLPPDAIPLDSVYKLYGHCCRTLQSNGPLRQREPRVCHPCSMITCARPCIPCRMMKSSGT